jgi:transcriptional regulator with XRE-family HTH domain
MNRPRNIVGPNLRRLRFQRTLSQAELAAVCQRLGWDASRDMIAKIEGQTRWVSDSEWVYLARALRVRLDDLLPAAARRGLESRAA